MILKNYEINKIQNINHFILFYGKNEGLKNEALNILIKNKNNISNYDEKEILDNENTFIESILSKSLFEQEKIVVIKRATDKILNIIQTLQLKKLDEVTIILNSENLDKKSKLRSFFEKDKELICVPFYPDNDQTLSKLTYNFLRDKNISISPSNVNLIVNKCSGDREGTV
jgi:DNA polymerase-3 subunit delta